MLLAMVLALGVSSGTASGVIQFFYPVFASSEEQALR
jgi:hypothetical protein